MGVVYKAGLFTTICRFLLTKMATRPSGSSGSVGSFSDIRSSFSTKEGFYRRVKASEHSRPTRQPLFGKELSPVQISLVSCKGKEGVQEWIAFNSSKELYFYPFEGVGKIPDLKHPHDKRTYKVPTIPVCHDFNVMTRSTEHLDLVVGFSTGPLQYINPLEKIAVCAFNEDGSVDSTQVSTVKWVPGSEHQFVSAHRSGNLYVWTTDGNSNTKVHVPQGYVLHKEPLDAKIYSVKQKHKGPLLYCWRIGHGSINAFAFSPDSVHIAIVSQDGFLRVYNFKEHTLYGRMRSYFGGLLCVCWSPDGRYAVTGGEDDLVTVWSFDQKRVVARGEGHKSYVTTVAFDPYMTVLPSGHNSPTNTSSEVPISLHPHTQGEASSVPSNPDNASPTAEAVATSAEPTVTATTSIATPYISRHGKEAAPPSYTAYRLGSIGQDTQLCLWDLSGDTLNMRRLCRGRSRATKQYSSRPVSTADLALETGATDDMAALEKVVKRTEETLRSSSRKEDEEAKQDFGGPTGEEQSSEEKPTANLLLNHFEAKERSPTISVSSTSSNTSKKGKKKKKEKAEKGDKDKKKPTKSSKRTLREPMKKVVGKLVNTFGGSSQSNGHGRGQMGNFETCYSDDIAPKMNEVNHMEPLVAEKISQERLSALIFREDCFLTACQEGFIQTWARPNVCIEDVQVAKEEGGGAWRTGGGVDEVNQHRSLYSNPSSSNSGINSPKPSSASDHDVPLKTTTM